MKNIRKVILIFLIFTAVASAEELSTSDFSIRTQMTVPEAPSARVQRGPNQTQIVNYQGVGFVYQEGVSGAQWAQLNGPRKTFGNSRMSVSGAPTALVSQDGKTGIGVSVRVQLDDIVTLSHTSHFGGAKRHITNAVIAPKSPVSVQMMRVETVKGSVTRVGPSVKLGRNASVWYGVATDGSPNLLLMTGNLRF